MSSKGRHSVDESDSYRGRHRDDSYNGTHKAAEQAGLDVPARVQDVSKR